MSTRDRNPRTVSSGAKGHKRGLAESANAQLVNSPRALGSTNARDRSVSTGSRLLLASHAGPPER